MPAPPEPAEVLLDKAREDQRLAARLAGDASVSNEHVGFFCQQTIEKSIKSVLSRHKIRYRRTHDLAELLDLLRDHDIAHPPDLEQSVALTPFAAEMRYDYLPPEQGPEPPFDREEAVRWAELAVQWATSASPPPEAERGE